MSAIDILRHRVFLAFILTPVALVPVAVITRIFLIDVNPSVSALSAAMVVSSFVAYPIIIVVALPLWLLFRRLKVSTFLSCVVGGAVSSLIGVWILNVLAIPVPVTYADITDLLWF